ncbi:MAG: hypothetical protein IJ705_03410 [Oscillospiraceae bacterium]|nr:hypothetical protein [Oscillospiraceae bacterium]
MTGTVSREEVLRRLRDLAFGKCNDAVKLAFYGKEDLGRIGKLDLRCLAGIHTTSGGFELKFVDRAKLIELLLAATEEKSDPRDAAAGLIAAIDGAAEKLGTVSPDALS